jgi:peptidoglycan hydrolase FlgJ
MGAASLGFGPSPAIGGFVTSPAIPSSGVSPAAAAKARATAQDFEAVFLNSMFGQMFTHVNEGPFNGGQAASTWRSFLTDEYSKNFAKAGGIGIADSVYKELIALQEGKAQ